MLVQMPLWCAILGGIFAFFGAFALGAVIYYSHKENVKKRK